MAGKMKDKKRKSVEKPECKYGSLCYRKNPEHLEQFKHPSADSDESSGSDSDKSPPSKILKADKGQSNLSLLSSSGSDSEEKPSTQTAKTEKTSRSASPKTEKASKSSSPKTEKASRSASPKTEKTSRSASPENVKENIKEKFLVAMPPDFYDFWEFSESINKKDPSKAFIEARFHLVGPYDVLSKKISNKDINEDDILCHWRYYYDPPEFQTVLKKDGDNGYHIGYFRDDPHEMPFGLASNVVTEGPNLKFVGDNIFCAMNQEITTFIKKTSKQPLIDKYTKIQSNLTAFVKSKKYSLDLSTPKTKARNKNVVSKTFHSLGIVVPLRGEVGYRPLPQTDAGIKSILTKICSYKTEEERKASREPLDELLTLLQFANDECDYGMGLELGIDLFCFGDPYLNNTILTVLPLAYELLDRDEYAQIIRAHIKNRRKGNELSIKPTKSSKITNFFTRNK